MEIKVNGESQTVESGTTIKSFLESHHINPNIVACELNMQIIRRAELGEVRLKDGDELEILRMIGGG